MPFEDRGSYDRFIAFNPEISCWALNTGFWNVFWLKEFHEGTPSNKFDILVGVLRYSIVGLFYDSLGNDEYAVKASSVIIETKRVNMTIWPQLENDIHRHFGCIDELVDTEEACNSKLPSQSKPDSRDDLLRKCSPQKDPCAPPRWLTQHLYVDSVENDGERPDKKKLHDLLDYMVDYVASWTGCDNAHYAQQMKDMLPLLVRCKIILEKEKEKTE